MTLLAETSYQLPDLPYDFAALEPVISAKIMELHYTKHHKGYVDNLNKALQKYHEAETKNDVPTMIALQPAIRFNGGGHINHSIFWTLLASPKKITAKLPQGELAEMIQRDFGSFDGFKEKLTAAAVGVQGSGWAWLGYHRSQKRLDVATCANQDPLSTQGLIPVLGIDVWEHAYYLQYLNVRADYVNKIWDIFDWPGIEKRFDSARL
jgi:Fe-Mn family superoxide dismutase